MIQITPVILCGGSGMRQWPLSRKSYAKQFVELIYNKCLLSLTHLTNGTGGPLLCVAAEAHRFPVLDDLKAADLG